MIQIIGRHWRGELPLLTSALAVGGLGALAVIGGARLLLSIVEFAELPLRAVAATQLLWLAFCCLLGIWVVVGVWRASAGASKTVRFGARVSLILAVIFFSPLALRSSETATELIHLVLGNDPLGPPASVKALDGTIQLRGPLGSGSAVAFERVVNSSNATKVTLSSPGGRIHEALRIASLIRRKGLDTTVAGHCSSACTLVLLAGRTRTVLPSARVGFHQSSMAGNSAADDDLASETFRSEFRSAGVPEEFIKRAFDTPSSSMWYPSEAELLQVRILTSSSLQNALTSSMAALQGNLPVRIDELTTLSRIQLGRHEAEFIYRVELFDDELDVPKLARQLQGQIVREACNDSALKSLIDLGATLDFAYFDKRATHLTTVRVTDCKPD